MKEGNEWVNLAEKSDFTASSAIQGKTGGPHLPCQGLGFHICKKGITARISRPSGLRENPKRQQRGENLKWRKWAGCVLKCQGPGHHSVSQVLINLSGR